MDSPYQSGQSCQLRLHRKPMSGPNAAPVTAGMIKSASTSVTWILSGSTRQGEAEERFRALALTSSRGCLHPSISVLIISFILSFYSKLLPYGLGSPLSRRRRSADRCRCLNPADKTCSGFCGKRWVPPHQTRLRNSLPSRTLLGMPDCIKVASFCLVPVSVMCDKLEQCVDVEDSQSGG